MGAVAGEVVAPVLVMFAMCAVAVIVVGLVMKHRRQMRELLSRERLAALDKGVEIPWEMDLRRPRSARRFHLKAGVLVLGGGVGLLLTSLLQSSWNDQRDLLALGLFFVVMGVTGMLYDRFVGKAEWERTTAMDEALMRAYIRRLEGGAGRADADAGDAK